jgi:hypothetical protein
MSPPIVLFRALPLTGLSVCIVVIAFLVNRTFLCFSATKRNLFLLNCTIIFFLVGFSSTPTSLMAVEPPLWTAAQKGDVTRVRQLIDDRGTDLNVVWSDWTPLKWACWGGRLEIAELLVAARADIEKADASGVTPLYVASLNGHLSVAELLVAAGANLEKEDSSGNTALAVACSQRHRGVALMLLAHGAKATAKACEYAKSHSPVLELFSSPLPASEVEEVRERVKSALMRLDEMRRAYPVVPSSICTGTPSPITASPAPQTASSAEPEGNVHWTTELKHHLHLGESSAARKKSAPTTTATATSPAASLPAAAEEPHQDEHHHAPNCRVH